MGNGSGREEMQTGVQGATEKPSTNKPKRSCCGSIIHSNSNATLGELKRSMVEREKKKSKPDSLWTSQPRQASTLERQRAIGRGRRKGFSTVRVIAQ